MPYFIWSEQFAVKVPLIDDQHRELLKIANQFYDAVKTKRDQDTIFQTLNALIRYAEQHFRDEEDLMAELGIPEAAIDEHHSIHERLIEEIFQLQMEMGGSEETTIHDLEQFLTQWAVNHILHEDKKILTKDWESESTDDSDETGDEQEQCSDDKMTEQEQDAESTLS